MPVIPLLKRSIRETANRVGLSIHRAPLANLSGLDLWRDIRVMRPQASLVFDVGANEGQTIDAVTRLWPNTRVVAFEPSPASVEYLRRRKPDPRVTIEAIAMGETPGTLPFYVMATESCNDSLNVPRWDEVAQTVTVNVDTVDNYCAERSISHVDVLKIDTQGHDLSVLRGARAMLERRAIGVITAEVCYVTMYEGQPTLRELLAFGDEVGYEFVGLYEQTYWDRRPAYANICWRASQ